MKKLLTVVEMDPWAELILPMELPLSVELCWAGNQIYWRPGVEYEYESEVASRLLRNRSIQVRAYMGQEVKVVRRWVFEVGDRR